MDGGRYKGRQQAGTEQAGPGSRKEKASYGRFLAPIISEEIVGIGSHNFTDLNCALSLIAAKISMQEGRTNQSKRYM